MLFDLVNHILDGGDIVFRTHEGAAIAAVAGPHAVAVTGVVVAYEADHFDPGTRSGWSVVVTGFARPVTEPAQLERYARMIRPWIGDFMESAVRITPDLVTGYRIGAPA